jgi:hypothetical protein
MADGGAVCAVVWSYLKAALAMHIELELERELEQIPISY